MSVVLWLSRQSADRFSQQIIYVFFWPRSLRLPRYLPLLSFPLVPSVGVKSAYSPAPSTVYSQPPPLPQRQVTALKTLSPVSPVSSSYTIYPVSTSVQQPQTTISSYSLGSTFSSTAAATSYPGIKKKEDDEGLTISYRISEIRASAIPYLPPFLFLFSEFQA